MRKIASASAVAVVSAIGLAVTAAPASASANSQCPVGKVCLYDGLGWNADLSGSADLWSDITASQSDLRRYYWHNGSGAVTGQSVQDDITSIKNRTNCWIYLYKDINYNGGGAAELAIGPGVYLGDLSARGLNNNITSVAFSC